MRILAVNAAAQAVSDADMATLLSGRTLPWLQDTTEAGVWTSWGPTYRDVVILDAENRKIGVFNVTARDLGDPENYGELKQQLLDAANGQ